MAPHILALLFSAAAVAGSLFLSLGMDLNACALCFYQRAFALGLVGVLGVGLLVLREQRSRLVVISLPLAVAGLGVAGFHTFLVASGKLECPAGIANLGTAPLQSLVVYALITAALLWGFFEDMQANGFAPLALALVLGGVTAYVLTKKGVNPPGARATSPDEPLKTCRVPYSG